jgi:hypothetical protein
MSQVVFLQVVEEVGVPLSACSSLFFLPSLLASVCWSLYMSRVVSLFLDLIGGAFVSPLLCCCLTKFLLS